MSAGHFLDVRASPGRLAVDKEALCAEGAVPASHSPAFLSASAPRPGHVLSGPSGGASLRWGGPARAKRSKSGLRLL